jgi:hypothetical protein
MASTNSNFSHKLLSIGVIFTTQKLFNYKFERKVRPKTANERVRPRKRENIFAGVEREG